MRGMRVVRGGGRRRRRGSPRRQSGIQAFRGASFFVAQHPYPKLKKKHERSKEAKKPFSKNNQSPILTRMNYF